MKFESLKDDLDFLISQINQTSNSAKGKTVTRLSAMLEGLEKEARAAPISYQNTMLEDVEEYKRQISNLGIPIEAQQSLHRTDASLARSTALALESERLGHETLDDLAIQRERLSGARDRLEEANREISSTRKLVRGIWVNLTTNKLLLCGIIVGEILIIIMIVYLKWFKPS